MTRIRFSWTPTSTETFRWVSGQNPRGTGFNGQTAPKAFRWIFEPDPGRVFGQKDYKQIEARLVAYLAGAKHLIGVFENPNANLYLEMGRALFKREIQKNTPFYTLCKAVIHAKHYREGPFKLAWDAGIPVREARLFQTRYDEINPEIPKWHDWVRETILTRGWLEVPYFGLRRVFYEALSFFAIRRTITDHQWKDAIAWTPQATVPLMTTRALVIARPKLPSAVWLHHHGHDSLVWSCPPELFDTAERILEAAMDLPIEINGRTLRVPVETSIGYSLGDMLEYEGKVISREEWERRTATSAEARATKILAAVYGPHLEARR